MLGGHVESGTPQGILVTDENRDSSWQLPHRILDAIKQGHVFHRIRSICRNYRGKMVVVLAKSIE